MRCSACEARANAASLDLGSVALIFQKTMLWCVRRSWRVPAGERPVREGCSEPPGSECCAGVGDGDCEAYTAIRWGVGLSLERDNVAEAETVISVEGNMCGTVMRGAAASPGSKATSRRNGTRRNLRGLTSDHRP